MCSVFSHSCPGAYSTCGQSVRRSAESEARSCLVVPVVVVPFCQHVLVAWRVCSVVNLYDAVDDGYLSDGRVSKWREMVSKCCARLPATLNTTISPNRTGALPRYRNRMSPAAESSDRALAVLFCQARASHERRLHAAAKHHDHLERACGV